MAAALTNNKDMKAQNATARVSYRGHRDWGFRPIRFEVRVDGKLVKSSDRSMSPRIIAHHVGRHVKATAPATTKPKPKQPTVNIPLGAPGAFGSGARVLGGR